MAVGFGYVFMSRNEMIFQCVCVEIFLPFMPELIYV